MFLYINCVFVRPFQALKQLPRENIQLATKFDIDYKNSDVVKTIINGKPEYIEASLERLGVYYVDLYHQHRVDTSVLIEETVSISLKQKLQIHYSM